MPHVLKAIPDSNHSHSFLSLENLCMAANQQDFAGSRLAWAAFPHHANTFPLPPRNKWELLNRFGSELGRLINGTSDLSDFTKRNYGKAVDIFTS